MYKIIIAVLMWCICEQAVAQPSNKGVFGSPVVPGPKGVYVFATDTSQKIHRPTLSVSYTVLREDKRGAGFKKIADIGLPANTEELKRRLGEPLLQEILQRRRLRSADDLYALIKAGRPDTLGVYSSVPAVMQALGILFIDKQVVKWDPGISYRLESNKRTLYQIALSDIRYTPLPPFKQYRTTVSDSTALVIWYAVPNRVEVAPQRIRAAYATVYSTAGTGGETNFAEGGRQYVFTRRDTLFVAYSMGTIKGSRTGLFIRGEDIAGNRGPASDTVHLLSLSFRNTLTIHHLRVADSVGSVSLQWDSLPAKAWCSGIEVLKSRSASKDFVVIDTLQVTAVAYRDRKVISGNMYFYQLRPVLFDLPQKGHITPAVVSVHAKKAAGRLLAPQGLTAGLTTSGDIRLSWEANPDLDVFAYYILRGTSKRTMQVISPAIRDTIFIDSLKGLNAGITYLYAVAALDMDTKWGDTSAPIGVQSPRARLLTAPGGILARATAQGIRISWNDIKASDPSVTGYLVFRRKKGESYFEQLNQVGLPGTHYSDSSALSGGVYEYGCASVDAWGHVSILSAIAEVGTGSLTPPADFLLHNDVAGIGLSVAASLGGGAAHYVIYRRTLTDTKFRKVGELSVGDTYTDKQVTKDQLYIYALAAIDGAAEGTRGGEKSIRRK